MGKGVVKLGEGNWAVKDGNLLAAKETNGRFKNAEFTVTRGTRATYVGRDGLIKESNLQDTNLVPSIITTEDNNGGVINYISSNIYSSTSDGTSASSIRPKFDFNTENGKTYKLIITPTGAITGTVNFDFYDGSSYLFSNYDFTTTKEIYFTDNGGVFGAFDGQQTYSIDSFTISVQEIKTDTPRIDFTDNTDGHLLLEPQSTNLITYSEDFEQWAEEVNIDVTNNSTTSPDGTQNAAKLQLTGSSGGTDGKISINVSPNATTHTFSVFAKKGSHNYIYIWMNMSVGLNITRWIDLNDGSVNEGSGTATVTTTSFSNDWWKIEYTFDATNLSKIKLEVADDGISTGTGGDNIYVWGAQLEALSYATSYIPTNGGQVTRDGEIVQRESIDEIDIPQEEGTIYLELKGYEKNTEIFNLNRSTSNSIHVFTNSAGALRVIGYYEPEGTGTGVNATLDNNTSKVAIAFKNGSFIVYADGEEELNTSTFVWTPTTSIDRLYFNRGGYVASQGLSKVKALRIYKEAFNTTQLDELTS